MGLSYDLGTTLPRVLLKGVGPTANIIKKEFTKKRESYRIVKDKELVDKLFRLPTESEISPDLYELVALLLVHVYRIEAKLKGVGND